MGVLALFVYVKLTLGDGGSKDASDGVKSIGLSFVQILSLLTTFPIAWPSVFTALFQVGGAVTVLGQHLVNLKCMLPERSEAEVFYASQITWAVIPIALLGACAATWRVLDLVCGQKVRKEEEEEGRQRSMRRLHSRKKYLPPWSRYCISFGPVSAQLHLASSHVAACVARRIGRGFAPTWASFAL